MVKDLHDCSGQFKKILFDWGQKLALWTVTFKQFLHFSEIPQISFLFLWFLFFETAGCLLPTWEGKWVTLQQLPVVQGEHSVSRCGQLALFWRSTRSSKSRSHLEAPPQNLEKSSLNVKITKRGKCFTLPLRKSLCVPLSRLLSFNSSQSGSVGNLCHACGRSLLSKAAFHTDRALPSTVGFL